MKFLAVCITLSVAAARPLIASRQMVPPTTLNPPSTEDYVPAKQPICKDQCVDKLSCVFCWIQSVFVPGQDKAKWDEVSFPKFEMPTPTTTPTPSSPTPTSWDLVPSKPPMCKSYCKNSLSCAFCWVQSVFSPAPQDEAPVEKSIVVPRQGKPLSTSPDSDLMLIPPECKDVCMKIISACRSCLAPAIFVPAEISASARAQQSKRRVAPVQKDDSSKGCHKYCMYVNPACKYCPKAAIVPTPSDLMGDCIPGKSWGC